MTDTLTEGWDRVEDHLDDAILIAWDECHKMYLALDETEANWFRTSDYTVVESTPAEMLATLHRWFDESCGLRFISGVRHNAENPNAGFVSLIEQGATDEYDDEEEE